MYGELDTISRIKELKENELEILSLLSNSRKIFVEKYQ